MSRAEAARAEDQVKAVRTTNQDASSGKWVWIACGSSAPAAWRERVSVGWAELRWRCLRVGGKTHNEGVQDPYRYPE